MSIAQKLKPKIQLPDRFSGDGSVQPDIWIDMYMVTAKIAGWDETDMITYLPMFLTGTAAMWYRTYSPTNDWKQLRKSFSEAFSLISHLQFPELALHERVFREGMEQISTYYYDKLRLCQKFDPEMTEEKKTQYLVKGLPSRWQMNLLGNKNATSGELLAMLHQLQENEIKYTMPAPVNNVNVTIESIKDIVRTEIAKVKEVASIEITKPNVIQCQICSKNGHSAIHCFFRYGNTNNYRGNRPYRRFHSQGNYRGNYGRSSRPYNNQNNHQTETTISGNENMVQ